MNVEKLKVLDLFSGIGGFSLGLEATGGFETVAFCEIDKFCQKVLRKHWPDVPIYDDVRTLNYDGPVDVICGGFPCQDISIGNSYAKGLAGERSGLWKEYSRIIGEIRPRFVIVENVSALLFRGLGDILADLAQMGYDAEWGTFEAAHLGAPHHRARIYILAYPSHSRRKECYLSPLASEEECWSDTVRFGETGYLQPTTEPPVLRMVDGLPKGLDRLRALGNAVVPQVVEQIGYAILEAQQQGE